MNRKSPAMMYRFCLGTLLVALLAGCSIKTPQVNYYSLVDTKQSARANLQNENLTVSIGPVILPEVLQKNQIATDGSNGRYIRSEFARWAGRLDRNFARAVGEQLAMNLGTERILFYPESKNLEPDWRVALEILALEGALGEEALLTVRWVLFDPRQKGNAIVMRSQFRQIPEQTNYSAWIAAQRQNIKNLGVEISETILEQAAKQTSQ